MKYALLIGLALALAGCSDVPEQPPVVGSFPPPGSECGESSAGLPRVEVGAAITSSVANSVVIDEDLAWVVQSGSNTVGRLDLDSGQYQADFVDVGDEHNPWAVAAGAGRLYVTNLFVSTLTVADRQTGAVLAEVAGSLDAPAGLAVGAGLVVVANTGFDGQWRPGSVSVFRVLDEAPFLEGIGSVPTGALNASEVAFDPIRGRFVVVSTGSRELEFVTSDGAVDVLDAGLLGSADPSALLASIRMPRVSGDRTSGAPGDLAISSDGSAVYIASAASSSVFKVDLETLTLVRGTDDPIVAYDGTGAQLTHIAAGPDGLMLVAAFNIDGLFVLDTGCDYTVAGPFSLGNAADLEGPVDLAYDPVRRLAIVPMTLSNSLTRVSWR